MLGKTNAGGGSAALNFKVVGGITAPSAPGENTIWVNTGNSISGWAFSATQPSAPYEGLVWFRIGSSSTAPFSALKRETLMVYPVAAWQYINGAWAVKTAKSYQNGAWVDWMLMLYEPGNVHEELTGGYEGLAIRYDDTWGGYAVSAEAPTVTPGSGSMVLSLNNESAGNNYSGSVLTANKIDLSSFTKITYECSILFGTRSNMIRFYISPSNSEYLPTAETIIRGDGIPASGKVVLSLPDNLSGEYYVGMNLLAGSGYVTETRVTVTRIVCE